ANADIAPSRRGRSCARIRRSAGPFSDLPGWAFSRLDTWPGGAAAAQGACLAIGARHRFGGRAAPAANRKARDDSADDRVVFYRRSAGADSRDVAAWTTEY